jgi:hypothetical protein
MLEEQFESVKQKILKKEGLQEEEKFSGEQIFLYKEMFCTTMEYKENHH